MDAHRIRLHKLIAARGIASRRAAEGLIAAGRVTVNGSVITQMGVAVDPDTDRIAVDGMPLAEPKPMRTIVLHKPVGYVCSTNARQGRTIYNLLKAIPERLVPIGRLDKDSEGVLILTNDGELANRLMHPRYAHEKVYRVNVLGEVTASHLRALNGPMTFDAYRTQPAEVVRLPEQLTHGGATLRFTLREGRNRQIRRMCEQVGLRVTRLVRIAQAGIRLGDLPSGMWRELTADELATLASA
jgi:23S rRNA pseudouridine2605 synthase